MTPPEWTEWIAVIGGILAIFGAAFATLYFVFKVGGWKTGVDQSIVQLKSDVSELKSDVSELKVSVKEILEKISNSGSSTVNKSSPLALNDLGQEISKELNAPKLVAGLAENLFAKAQHLSDFDIQELSKREVKNHFLTNNEPTLPMKDCAYKHGIGIYAVLDVLAVELRDRLIKMRQMK